MKKKSKKIPKKFEWIFWSYNLNSLDILKDKNLIITQILNHGDWEAVKWVLNTYSLKELKEVLKNPSRGMWMKDVLNFWLKILKIKLPSRKIKNALFKLNPK